MAAKKYHGPSELEIQLGAMVSETASASLRKFAKAHDLLVSVKRFAPSPGEGAKLVASVIADFERKKEGPTAGVKKRKRKTINASWP